MEGSRKQSLDAVEVYIVDAQLPIIMGVACFTHNVIVLAMHSKIVHSLLTCVFTDEQTL